MAQPRDVRGRFQKTTVLPAPEALPKNAVIGLKGFSRHLTCRGVQFEVGRSYHVTGSIECCKHGFHFCTSPLDTFAYYPPTSSRYAVVAGSGAIREKEQAASQRLIYETKVAASDLVVLKELSLDELVNSLVCSVSKCSLQGINEKPITQSDFDLGIKYRIVQAPMAVSCTKDDVQDILCVKRVMVNADTHGYAGPLYGEFRRTQVSVVCDASSIAFNEIAISLAHNSIARGTIAAITADNLSIAFGWTLAYARGAHSVAITSKPAAIAICGDTSKLILHGNRSIGILSGPDSSAEVYGKDCCLMFRPLPANNGMIIFHLVEGTHLLYMNSHTLVQLVVGTDIKPADPDKPLEYTAEQIRAAFKEKLN